MPDFALLAPVPHEHLVSARATCETRGKVAFGSRAGMVFADLESREKKGAVNVLIHASGGPSGPPTVTWRARSLRMVPARQGAHPDGMLYRPASTAKYPLDNAGNWLIFWEVDALRALAEDETVRISTLFPADRETRFKATFKPEGPIVVRDPD